MRRMTSLGRCCLRRASERIDRDATVVYRDAGIGFEQRWMGVLRILSEVGPTSVSVIAAELWSALIDAGEALAREARGLVEALDRLDAALDRESLAARALRLSHPRAPSR